MPPKIASNAQAQAVFLQAMENARCAYEELVEIGLGEGRGAESVQEDARFVLPNAAETKIVVTMNARELRHFFRVRCCRRAQWEINALSWRMRTIVRGVSPYLFEGTGPSCLYGECGEGKMTCGQPYRPDDVDSAVPAVGAEAAAS
jgi:thymidylate synthase (FAD)